MGYDCEEACIRHENNICGFLVDFMEGLQEDSTDSITTHTEMEKLKLLLL